MADPSKNIAIASFVAFLVIIVVVSILYTTTTWPFNGTGIIDPMTMKEVKGDAFEQNRVKDVHNYCGDWCGWSPSNDTIKEIYSRFSRRGS
jgi:hypothetical protein